MSTPPISPRDDLALVEGYHSPQLDVAVRLNTNESPYPPPEGWKRELAAEVERIEWNRYPDRAAAKLRAAVAGFHGIDPATVLCANGSNEALQALCLAFGGAGRRAITFEPGYALHAWIARITGTEVVEAERAEDFTLAPDAAMTALEKAGPDLVFLASPNNPTGLVEQEDTVAAVADWAAAHRAVLVVDEAYAEFAPWSALDMVDEGRTLAVTRTFSKTWSMAAARLGYLVGPPWMVGELEKVLLPYHMSAVIQAAGRLALGWSDEMHGRVASLVEERERLVRALDELSVDVWPSGANFILFRPRGLPGAEVWQGLVDRSVLVRNCSSWPRLRGCLRVTVGTPEEDERFLTALREILAS